MYFLVNHVKIFLTHISTTGKFYKEQLTDFGGQKARKSKIFRFVLVGRDCSKGKAGALNLLNHVTSVQEHKSCLVSQTSG